MASDSPTESERDSLVSACPECDTTTYYARTHKTPEYRCHNGHEFKDPVQREPKYRGRKVPGSAPRYRCYQCDSEFRSDAVTDSVTCPHCASHILLWRAKVAFYRGNKQFQRLADGPITRTDGLSDSARRNVYSLKLKGGSDGGGGGKHIYGNGGATFVYFLPGDERRAVDLFIEENHEIVKQALETANNAIAEQWSTEMYQLLVEQWEWKWSSNPDALD